MGKRKRGGPLKKDDEKPSEFEDRDASKLRINGYEDVADSEDEFMFNRDKILLDDPSSRKSQRQQAEDEFLQHSDEEVLGRSGTSADEASADEDEDIDDADLQEADGASVDDDVDGEVGSGDEIAEWGGSKSAFYNTDKITTREEALAEEQEARRLQQKQLKSLREADFGFDEGEWIAEGQDAEADDADGTVGGVVTEKLPQLHVSPDMSEAEKLKVLRRRYPEFEGYAKALSELQPVWGELKRKFDAYAARKKAADSPRSVVVTRYRALSAYLGALAMYFSIFTSPAKECAGDESALPLPAHDLREHEVSEYVSQCGDLWRQVKHLDEPLASFNKRGFEASANGPETIGPHLEEVPFQTLNESPQSLANGKSEHRPTEHEDTARLVASEARRAARRAKVAASFEQAASELSKASKPSRKQPLATADYHLADEAPLDEREAAEKAQKKKSLRFYTSRIAQKANKDARMADSAAGDEDLPYKERFRDKVERLNREAEARGKRGRDDDLHDSTDDDEAAEPALTDADREATAPDTDYDDLIGRAASKKAQKRQRETAYAEARDQGGRVERIPQAEVGPDGRRELTYAIAKNKGVTPKRRMQIKNPRVKKRKKFEDKSKKLRTMKATYKGGEGRGGYGGELTGIKTGLVKGVRL